MNIQLQQYPKLQEIQTTSQTQNVSKMILKIFQLYQQYKKYSTDQILVELSYLLNMSVADLVLNINKEKANQDMQESEQSHSTCSSSIRQTQEEIRATKIIVQKETKKLPTNMIKHNKFTQEEIMMVWQLYNNCELPENEKIDFIQNQLKFRKQVQQIVYRLKAQNNQ
ncbi:Hypothetical_protein [Hexamita inflata]|uniref:Hypothetical_protein n=1 Tax=Hexamita inflata TaxID=28002 RepID=A0AA86N7H7_9EUKA|nr:Hypothetical protein HINF_LOCUS1781 [Hexamita inflata]